MERTITKVELEKAKAYCLAYNREHAPYRTKEIKVENKTVWMLDGGLESIKRKYDLGKINESTTIE